MNRRLLLGILLGSLVILATAGLAPLAIYKHYVLDVQAAPPSRLIVPPQYQVFDGSQVAVILIPQDTANEQDVAAIQGLSRQLLVRGNRALIVACTESNLIPNAYQCGVFFVAQPVQ